MEDYIFFEGTLHSDYTLAYEESLFNLRSFNSINNNHAFISFYILNERTCQACAGIHFCLDGDVAKSPFRAPFGSMEFSHRMQPKVVYTFLEYVEKSLIRRGLSEVVIKNPPREYSQQNTSLLETFLFNQKYGLLSAELTTIIPVAAEFGDIIRHSEKLRVKQARAAGLRFAELPVDRLDEVYDSISLWHKQKGYNVSLTLAEMKNTVTALPDRYHLFVIYKDERIIAATVSIRVTKSVLYSFLANHDVQYNALSPLVMLMNGIYDFCRNRGISMFDLGTSALHGKPNFSLLDFKIHLGGMPSGKLSFYKNLR